MDTVSDKITDFIKYTYICGLVEGVVISLVTSNPHIPYEELWEKVMNALLPIKDNIQGVLEDSPSLEEVIEDSCKSLDGLRSTLILKERLDRASEKYGQYLNEMEVK